MRPFLYDSKAFATGTPICFTLESLGCSRCCNRHFVSSSFPPSEAFYDKSSTSPLKNKQNDGVPQPKIVGTLLLFRSMTVLYTGPCDYSSRCNLLFAEVSSRVVRYAAPQVRSFRNIRVNFSRKTPPTHRHESKRRRDTYHRMENTHTHNCATGQPAHARF